MNGQNRRVVVTGLGPATPIGLGVEAFWEALLAGQCGIDSLKAFEAAGFASRVAGELPDFKFGDYIPKTYRKSAKVMARDILIAVVCAYHAVKDANLKTKCIVDRGEADGPIDVDSTRFGANIGAGLICANLDELAAALSTAADDNGNFDIRKWGAEGMQNLTPLWLLKFLPNMLACHVTIVHDAQAPSNTITCGEASSHLAIGEAFRTIGCGDADVCICGGAESKINPMALARPQLLDRLNTSDNDSPQRASRAFASDASGMVASEGGGLIILEDLDRAKTRGARIYAEVVGFGAATNTRSWHQPEPDGESIAFAIHNALSNADASAADVDLVNPFGTGIPAFDVAEATAYCKVIGDRLTQIPAMTTRGAVGVNGAGTGSIDFAATVLALANATTPPSINTAPRLDQSDLQFVDQDPVDAPVSLAVTTSYALSGGQAAALVLRKYQE